ncbi:hypothetical protein C0J52_21664 [Blattella germanica]|nr:hypothetical protein C0J52_21664 [Blattella germanica]
MDMSIESSSEEDDDGEGQELSLISWMIRGSLSLAMIEHRESEEHPPFFVRLQKGLTWITLGPVVLKCKVLKYRQDQLKIKLLSSYRSMDICAQIHDSST